MPRRLEGKVSIVTGAASGIGRACAVRFASEGASVVAADLHPAGEATAEEIRSAGGHAVFHRCDVSSRQDCEATVALAAHHFGGIDVLLHAAGILHARYVSGDDATGQRDREGGDVIRKPVEHWDKVLAVNLTGTMLMNRAVAGHMVERCRGGSIVNIASAAASIPLAGSADYCVSKAGVWMLTKVLALELAPYSIRVNAIGPGAIATPMIAATLADDARKRRAEQDTPLGRLGDPDDIANAALFLSSSEASFITGEILFPTGGRFVH